MSTSVKIVYCDMCEKPLEKVWGGGKHEEIRKQYHMHIEMNGGPYSRGGGADSYAIDCRHGGGNYGQTICEDCFSEFAVIADKVNKWQAGRKGINWTEPHIPDIEKRNGDNVSDVRDDIVQPERCISKILRKLPFIPRKQETVI